MLRVVGALGVKVLFLGRVKNRSFWGVLRVFRALSVNFFFGRVKNNLFAVLRVFRALDVNGALGT